MRTAIHTSQALEPVFTDVQDHDVFVDIGRCFEETIISQVHRNDAALVGL